MKRAQRILSISLLSCGLLACGGGQVAPQDQFYRLADNIAVNRRNAPVLQGSVAVAPFKASSIYHDRAIVYAKTDRPLELHQHHYHFWIDAPPRLLQNQLEQTLRAANIAERVFSTRASQTARYQINGILYQFEQEMGDKQTSVRVALRLELVDLASSRQLLVKDYAVTSKPVSDSNVYAAVESFQQTVDSIFAEWITALSTDCPVVQTSASAMAYDAEAI